jgi:glycosyltransferase involved in cell wall biosynthesis
MEILVVDDHSTDRTAEIARSYPVTLIEANPLPPGWTGKSNAVACGARQAKGKWLLFTDADTVHLPESLESAVREAEEHGVAMLSYSPEQEVHGWMEKAVMVVIFAELASQYQPSKVSDPNSPAAAANGQYLMISREMYAKVGGHAAIAGSLLEDVDLAKNVKRAGGKILFRIGRGRVRTRMYRTLPQLIEGWTKNLRLLFPSAVALAGLRMMEFLLLPATLLLTWMARQDGEMKVALLAGAWFVVLLARFLRRVFRAHFGWDANVLAWLGLPIFSFLLLRSVISYKLGRVSWKGRTYPGDAQPS